jgi:guanine nucleotide-binding protein G(I)/G(S)/G(T) subunit beta-1
LVFCSFELDRTVKNMASSAGAAKAAVMKLAADVEEARKARNVELSDSGAVNKIAELASKPDGGKYEFSVARKLIGHLGKVYAQNWAGHEARMVSASQDGKLIDWNALENTKVHLVNLVNAWVMTCGFDQSDTPRYVASGGLDNACTIFDVTADMPSINESKCVLEAHDGYLSCCRFVNNSSIVTSSGDSTCIVWDVETARESQRFPDHAGDVMG